MNPLNNIITNINSLSLQEKKHIFDILNDSKCPFSSNKNGFFFDLSKISNQIIDKITKCINLIHRHRSLIAKMDARRDEEILYYTNLIKQKNETTNLQNKQLLYDTLSIKEITSNISWIIEKDIILTIKKEIKDFNVFKFKPNHPFFHINESCKRLRRESKMYYKKTKPNELKDFGSEQIAIEFDDVLEVDLDIDIEVEDNNNNDVEIDAEIDAEIDVEINLEDQEENEIDIEIDDKIAECSDYEQTDDENDIDDELKMMMDIFKLDSDQLTIKEIIYINNFKTSNLKKNQVEKIETKINECNEKYIHYIIKAKKDQYKFLLSNHGFIFHVVLLKELFI
jgi:hypothetical protein